MQAYRDVTFGRTAGRSRAVKIKPDRTTRLQRRIVDETELDRNTLSDPGPSVEGRDRIRPITKPPTSTTERMRRDALYSEGKPISITLRQADHEDRPECAHVNTVAMKHTASLEDVWRGEELDLSMLDCRAAVEDEAVVAAETDVVSPILRS